MSELPDDELARMRALSVHDTGRGTARLRTEIELPTFEEFAEICEAEAPEEEAPEE